jgi:hypothetical protein
VNALEEELGDLDETRLPQENNQSIEAAKNRRVRRWKKGNDDMIGISHPMFFTPSMETPVFGLR